MCFNWAPLQTDKKKKEEGKGKAAPEKTEMKPDLKGAEAKAEEDKRKEKPKVQRTTAPSHAKFRSTGKQGSIINGCGDGRDGCSESF